MNKTLALPMAKNLLVPLFNESAGMGRGISMLIRLFWVWFGTIFSIIYTIPFIIIFLILAILPFIPVLYIALYINVTKFR